MANPVKVELPDSEPPGSERRHDSDIESGAACSGVLRCAEPVEAPTILEGELLSESAIAEALNMAARAGRWDLFEQLALLTADQLGKIR